MHEPVPKMRRLAILYDERYVGLQTSLEAHQVAADAIHLEVCRFPVRSREDIDRALTSWDKEHVDGILVFSSGVIAPEIPLILKHAVERGMPSAFPNPWPVERGGLLSYAPNISDTLRRMAVLVDRILRGADLADLPFEYPTRYDLTINLKTANALGVVLPQAVLVRADRLIE